MDDPVLVDRKAFPSFGECIYCGAKANETELTDEHIIPFSLGGNAYIKDGSCRACAVETTRIEDTLGRKVFWDFRAHANVQTRRPKERPTEFPFTVSIDGGDLHVKNVPVSDHPYFTPMPVWGLPGILSSEQPTTQFKHYKAHVFYWIPPSIRDVLDLSHGQVAEIPFPNFKIDHHRFARAIAKIAYCQAILKYGPHGFRKLVTPDLILGRYPCVPHFVGCEIADPPPPEPPSVQHKVQIWTEVKGPLKLIVVTVRLFANSGVENHGPPIYEVVVGAPLSAKNQSGQSPFRKKRPNQKPIKILLPGHQV